MILQHVYLVVLWVLFSVLHSLLAANWWKVKMSRLLGSSFRFYRFFYSVFATLSLMFLLYVLITMQSPRIFKLSGFLKSISLIGGIAGIAIMIACVKKYFSVVTGIKAFAEKSSVALLQTSGLHSYTRHPLYFGTLLFVWNLFVLFPSLSNLISCGMMSIYTVVGIRIEERKLVAEFGESYTEYCRKVPMLFPRFFLKRSRLSHSLPKAV